jgi:transcriptional activator
MIFCLVGDLEVRDRSGTLDTLAFHRLVEQAEAARTARRTADEIACLRGALRLWRGPRPLADLPAEAFADVVESLRGRRKRIAVRLFALENSRGAHAVVLDDLRQFVAEDPADGELCRPLGAPPLMLP